MPALFLLMRLHPTYGKAISNRRANRGRVENSRLFGEKGRSVVGIPDTGCRLSGRFRPDQAVALHLRVEQLTVNVEPARRLRAVTAAGLERLADHLVFELRDCGWKVALGDVVLSRLATAQQMIQVSGVDYVSAHEYDSALDRVSELAHVSRPGVLLETGDGCRG
jgi:hypothetical protein